MHTLKVIRERLGVTQQALADGLGCAQGNIGNYERGQALPVERARRLIAFARERGLDLTLDHVYGDAPLPEIDPGAPSPAIAAEGCHG